MENVMQCLKSICQVNISWKDYFLPLFYKKTDRKSAKVWNTSVNILSKPYGKYHAMSQIDLPSEYFMKGILSPPFLHENWQKKRQGMKYLCKCPIKTLLKMSGNITNKCHKWIFHERNTFSPFLQENGQKVPRYEIPL